MNEETFDLVFIDGLHHSDVFERDVRSALGAVNSNGMIVCHDLNPTTEGMQNVPRQQLEWTGDVWRGWLLLRKELGKEHRMFVLDTDYGVGIICPGLPPQDSNEPEDLQPEAVTFQEFTRKKRNWLPLVDPHSLPQRFQSEYSDSTADVLSSRLKRHSAAERPFLLYCPTNNGDHISDFTNDRRLFDVAFNDYSGNEVTGGDGAMISAEWVFDERGHKWPCIFRNLPKIERSYDLYAFFDNDVEISVDDLNSLFLTGTALQLDLFQAALTEDSHTSYPALKHRHGSLVRESSFVEIMMPVFSRSALERCFHTFDDSESGWGLDCVWKMYLEGAQMAIVDAIQARHARPVSSADWVLDSGLTPQLEMEAVLEKHRKALQNGIAPFNAQS